MNTRRTLWLCLTAAFVLILSWWHVSAASYNGPPILFGDRQVAIFDLWTIEHFLLGIMVGFALNKMRPELQKDAIVYALALLMADYAWEAVELAMELGATGSGVSHWKQGFEHWSNRLIGDPGAVLLGGLVQQYYPNAWRYAVGPWIIWGLLNYRAADSMYIQNLLFN